MLRRTLPILLAVLIAACPMTCQVMGLVSHDCGAGAASTVGGCENCRRAAGNGAGRDGDAAPIPACPCQEKGQNCICSGALIDTDDGYETELLPSLDLLFDLSRSAHSDSGSLDVFSHDEDHLHALSGRDVRALISSFLC